MFVTADTPIAALCLMAIYFIVGPLVVLTAGLCGWLVRQAELAADKRVIEEGASGPSSPALAGLPRGGAATDKPSMTTAA
ncbi:hypothetical protein [Limnoglobus roseus]|uniref:Uncharacterized protein n=1 Tax=Limnoglobus roseus TaxID=2598579 RepID=A0A5C1AFJ4_9BACT|nr:hypothetical protein [Limnoglobus roseus]QEL16746.1 hypothetical protein PX52LOC_03713 [Limnoglobus roseus]